MFDYLLVSDFVKKLTGGGGQKKTGSDIGGPHGPTNVSKRPSLLFILICH